MNITIQYKSSFLKFEIKKIILKISYSIWSPFTSQILLAMRGFNSPLIKILNPVIIFLNNQRQSIRESFHQI